jgi:hypothetical protein
LVALRAWLVHGERDPKRATSRFQQWDSLIAQALVWYGYADPMRGGDELRDVDPVKEAKREVVRQMAAAFGEKSITAVELQKHAMVRQAIASARGKHEREVTPMMVAKYIGTVEDVRLGLDWRVIKGPVRAGHPQQWRLEYTGEGDAPIIDQDDENDFAPSGDDDEDA